MNYELKSKLIQLIILKKRNPGCANSRGFRSGGLLGTLLFITNETGQREVNRKQNVESNLCEMNLLFPLALVIAAIITTYSASKRRRNADSLFAKGIKTQGVVIRHNVHYIAPGNRPGPEYPVIRFTTLEGSVLQVERMTQVPMLNKAEAVTIFYDRVNPQNIVFDSEPGSPLPYLLPVSLWIIAFVAMVVAFVN